MSTGWSTRWVGWVGSRARFACIMPTAPGGGSRRNCAAPGWGPLDHLASGSCGRDPERELHEGLRTRADELSSIAYTDPLTGLRPAPLAELAGGGVADAARRGNR